MGLFKSVRSFLKTLRDDLFLGLFADPKSLLWTLFEARVGEKFLELTSVDLRP